MTCPKGRVRRVYCTFCVKVILLTCVKSHLACVQQARFTRRARLWGSHFFTPQPDLGHRKSDSPLPDLEWIKKFTLCFPLLLPRLLKTIYIQYEVSWDRFGRTGTAYDLSRVTYFMARNPFGQTGKRKHQLIHTALDQRQRHILSLD